MHSVLIFLLSAASASGSSIRVMSYNLYGWNAMGQEAWKKPNLWKTIMASQPDVLGVQEVDGHEFECAGAIGNDYQVVDDGFNGDAIIYRTSVLTLQNYGKEGIDEMDQWGKRWIGYANFIHNSGKRIDFFNTHFCVCSAGDLQASATRVANTIAAHRSSSDSLVLFTGDLNCFDGSENSLAIRYLKGELGGNPHPLEDTFRVADPSGNGETFPGVKIDYVMASAGTPVLQAWIDRSTVPYGEASDHWAVSADVSVDGGSNPDPTDPPGPTNPPSPDGCCQGQTSMTDPRCSDCGSDPYGCLGCNACGIPNCRFCGTTHTPPCS